MGKTLLKTAALAAVAGALALGSVSDAEAQGRVKWKMQAAFASTLAHLGPAGQRIAEDITTMSDGKFQVKFFEPGALIPPLECFDAVSKGSVESCYTTPGYHTGKYPGLAFMTAVPFGPGLGGMVAGRKSPPRSMPSITLFPRLAARSARRPRAGLRSRLPAWKTSRA
jgi:TRAP-type mannitol/chloroaromatic compound transport system substrate-binding protein